MTGPKALSVDDPKFSHSGDYNYDYDFTCEEDSASDDGGLFLSDKSEEIDKLLNENDASSIDHSPIAGHIAASSDENSQENDPRKGNKQKQPSRGKLDPPTFDDYICIPTSACFEPATGAEESVIASRINEYKRGRKEKKRYPDSTLEPSLTDAASFSDDDCCANLDLDFGDDIDCLFPSSSPDLFFEQTSKSNTQVAMKAKRRRRKPEDSNKNDSSLMEQQLLCIHICANPNCDDDNCRPPDLQSISKDKGHIVGNSPFFYVTVALILKRDQEMREAAEGSKTPKRRWNGSLLYQKCQELQIGRQSRKNNDEPRVITLHPVRTLAQNHVISPKFPWWQSWLTVCIRAYYNTGSLRIPKDCHGLEILLALDFFGILYTGPDQLIFDAPQVKSRCQRWSQYFIHRPGLAQWLVNRLHERQPKSTEVTSLFHRPFIFCTHPEALTEGYSLFVDEHEFPIEVFQASLDVENSESFTGSSQKRKAMISAELVHNFFAPSVVSENTNSADSFYAPPHLIPAMMREDFVSYMQHVLPDVEVSFSLRKVQLVSIQQGVQTRKQKECVLSAVLVLSWNPSQRLGENKQVDPPALNTNIQEDDQVSIFSASTSSSDSSEVSNGGTSFSAAPTDEMAFGKLLNDSHRAVSQIVQPSTKEKLSGPYIEQESPFYFRQDSELESLNKTLDTTDDTSVSSNLVDGPTERSGSMSTDSSTPCEQKILDTEVPTTQRQASQGASVHASEQSPSQPPSTSKPGHSELPHQWGADEKSQGSKKSITNKFGYEVQHFQQGSVQADHVYAELCEETTIVDPKRYAQHHNAPLPFVHASLHDQQSVTSSITRQPESFLSGLRNISMKGQTLQEDGDADNQCCRTKKETIKYPDQIHGEDTASVNQENGTFNKRIEVFLGGDSNEKKKMSKKKKKNRSIRDSTQETSLLDQEDNSDKQTEETCQLLNDLYDFFIAEDKPSVVVVPPLAEATGMHRRQSSQSIGMESLSNQPEVVSWRTKHKKLPKVSNEVANDSFERKTKDVTLAVSDAETATRRDKSQHAIHRPPGNWHVSPVYRAKTKLPGATGATSAHCKGNTIPNGLPEGVDEVENGIEVFHLPKSSPSTEQGTTSSRHAERSRQEQSNVWMHDEEHPARARRFRKLSTQSSDTAKHRGPGNSATDWQSSGKLSRSKKKRADSSGQKRGFFGLKLRPRK